MVLSPQLIPTLDTILTAQFVVAWAGEAAGGTRLGWWRTDLVSQDAGGDFFRRLTPATARWAALQSAREAARFREDAARQGRDRRAGHLITLFRLGPALDEPLEVRIRNLKQDEHLPEQALPTLGAFLRGGGDQWDPAAFLAWVQRHPAPAFELMPAGRRLKGALPTAPEAQVSALVGALAPLTAAYPCPHYRVSA